MVSPTLCPTLSSALKLKFFPLPMVIAAGVGQMMINCALWRRALSATDKRQRRRITTLLWWLRGRINRNIMQKSNARFDWLTA